MKAGKDFIGVGLGVIITNEQNQIYLQKRGPGCRDQVGEWELPGGELERGEDLETAAVREVEEETGLLVKIKDCVVIAQELYLSHWLSFTYTAEVIGGEMSCREPTKVVAQGFFDVDKLPQPMSRISAQNIAAYCRGNKYVIDVIR